MSLGLAMRQHHFHIRGHCRLNGFAIACSIGGKHQTGCECAEDVAQLVVVLADGGVGGRCGAIRHSGHHATQSHQSVFKVVLRQDHHGAIGVEASVDQALCNVSGRIQRMSEADVLPVARSAICILDATRK